MGALLTTISPLMAQSGRVRIRVTDPMGAAAQGAEASLSEKDGKTISAGRSDEVGEIILTGIPIGIFQIRVSHPGYKIVLLVGVPVLNADEQKLDVKLEVGEAMGVVSFKKRKRWWIFH
jgi:hypothetical protein